MFMDPIFLPGMSYFFLLPFYLLIGKANMKRFEFLIFYCAYIVGKKYVHNMPENLYEKLMFVF